MLEVGRYAPYVDAAYGLSALALALLVGASVWSARRWRRRAERGRGRS